MKITLYIEPYDRNAENAADRLSDRLKEAQSFERRVQTLIEMFGPLVAHYAGAVRQDAKNEEDAAPKAA